jgi:hypothetical protein
MYSSFSTSDFTKWGRQPSEGKMTFYRTRIFFTGVTSVGLLSSRSNGASGTLFNLEA